jgi:transcription antitermination factor NusG
MNTNTQDTNVNTKLSAIDKALAAAKARKEAKDGATEIPKAKGSKPKAERIKLDDATKAAAKAAKDEARSARRELMKQQREERRAAKALERANAKMPHMKKIERAAASLPSMSDSMTLTFNEVTTNFSAEQITALALHLQHFNRVKATERALKQELAVGQKVRIISGVQKYVGMTGTVEKAQRIRCFVSVPGSRKPVYLFTSDVELIEETAKATGTDG